jgi:hypothetical protein
MLREDAIHGDAQDLGRVEQGTRVQPLGQQTLKPFHDPGDRFGSVRRCQVLDELLEAASLGFAQAGAEEK